MAAPTQPRYTFSQVRKLFDKILVRHMSRLPRPVISETTPPFTLASLTTILLLVEREKEMSLFFESPPERYTRKAFMDDITDIGIEIDDDLMISIQDLETNGFFSISKDSRFYVKNPAFVMANVLENALPDMPGMSLVAYIVQTIREAVTGRKDLEKALKQLDGLLAGSMESAVKKITPEIKRGTRLPTRKRKDLKKIPDAVKQVYIEKLTKGRSLFDAASGPKVITSQFYTGEVEVKELFPKKQPNTSETGPEVETEADTDGAGVNPEPVISMDDAPQAMETTEFASPPDRGAAFWEDSLTAEESPSESEDAPHPPSAAQVETPGRPLADLASVNGPREGSESDSTPGVPYEVPERGESSQTDVAVAPSPEEPAPDTSSGRSRPLRGEDVQRKDSDPSADVKADSTEKAGVPLGETEIDKRIQQLENGMPLSCPLCREGRISTHMTETKKTFYACSNNDCRFISWGKPLARECPACRNPFLIESTGKQGEAVLKCPRAACGYLRNASTGPDPAPPTHPRPRKKVVKKVVVRRR